MICGKFPGGPVVQTQCSHCLGLGLFPGWGTKIPQATKQPRKKESDPELTQILELSGKNGRTVIITVFHVLKT